MTIETSTSIELSDIAAVEFQCAVCRAKTVIPVGSFKDAPTHCSSCWEQNRKQWLVPGSQDFHDIRMLAQTIQLFSGPQAPAGFQFRLHLKQLASQT